MRVSCVCPTCGKTFEKLASAIRPEQKRVFCSHACHSKGNFVDGLNAAGYRMISVEGKQVYEHRWVVEQHIGRKLLGAEHIHHINGIKSDNRIENLSIVDNSSHQREHVSPSFDIDRAKMLYDAGVGYRKLSEMFGVARQNIRGCFIRRGWHVLGRTRKRK